MASNNPYTSVTISGFDASPPSDDGAREAQNQVEWAKHVDKLGTPLKNGVESVDANVSAAFSALIVTDDPAQEGMIEAMRRFMPRAPDQQLQLKRLVDRVESPLTENRVVLRQVFS